MEPTPTPEQQDQRAAAEKAQRSRWRIWAADVRRFVFGPRRLSLFGRLGIVAMCVLCFGLYIEIGRSSEAAAEKAYQRSVSDNAPLCAAAELVAYPPPDNQPQTEYGRLLADAMQRFVESPDCPN